MTEETALHLVAAGARFGGVLRVGAETVAQVSAEHGAWRIVDVSPRAHAARGTTTGALGDESGGERYALEGREERARGAAAAERP